MYMIRIVFKWILRKRLLLLSVLSRWSRALIVYRRLSVSASCLKYLLFLFVRFPFQTFAMLSSAMSQSVKRSWLSALTVSVVTPNSHRLLVIGSVISHLHCVGHCVTHRRLTASEWSVAGAKLGSSMAGETNAALAVTCAQYLSF